MNKLNLLLALTALLLCASLQAQDDYDYEKGPYMRVNVGYGIAPITPEVQGVEYNSDGYPSNIYGTTMPGLYFGIGGGYMFNKYVGVDLGLAYTLGQKKVTNEIRESSVTTLTGTPLGDVDVATVTEYSMYETYTRQLRLSPGVVFRLPNEGKLTPFTRLSLMLPVTGYTYTDVTTDVSSDEVNPAVQLALGGALGDMPTLDGQVNVETQTRGKFSLGWNFAFGLDYELGDNLSLFGELDFISLSIKSRDTEITSLTGDYTVGALTLQQTLDAVNGGLGTSYTAADLGLFTSLEQIPESRRTTEYVDELDANSAANNEELSRRPQYSSFGINIGVKYRF